ncbi:MAG: hypothetical protein M0R74_08945 [Dehalococcoidia bacterium]|nr:hypothetical protein [Dehalococcoidia bacterium]
MQPFDWQLTSTALMEDRYREMVRTKWASEAMHGAVHLRLPFAARLRVLFTGRIDITDLPVGGVRTGSA